ncbi:bifunctional alpha,alpha-trehalose-phosphate synthase (UDP-forming)/trehalose-phosphatase [Cytophagaceae bacterium ABcell3]|nr:bifunctional alpha,alpha-trehalose-phosphate synthase (UDP-forming)/trehalose-phosphatase [Cytophagaceae bacterium ABcell3]
MSKTIIVSNRLPLSIQKKGDKLIYATSAGGLATGLGSIYKEGDNVWIGWPGIYLNKTEEKEEVRKELAKESMAPVYLTKNDIEKFYEGFSNSTLWPLFHYFPSYTIFSDDYWDTYKKVNILFCNEVLKYANDDDVIWIHDYQLLLLPNLIREQLPNATIGFFNHIPFPSYEIFRALPWRKELLRGMIGADLLGFHTYDDVRHFLSSVNRIIGIDNKMGQLRVNDRVCQVDSFSMGIDYEKFAKAAESEESIIEVENYRKILGDKKLIISIDRLDYSKGIPERLKAIDLFFEKYPEYRGKISFLKVIVPSRDKVDLYKKLKIEIDELVGRINGKYGRINWLPIHYFYRSFPFHTLCAFYNMSDIALVTPLRDGMNLVCKEYIASKTDKTGVLILSEMAGAARELSEALIINPNDIQEMADTIHKALKMPKEEQIRRNDDLQHIIERYDIHNWVQLFMKSLRTVKEKQKEMSVKRLTADKQKNLIDHYISADKRILLLDYDGTLMPFSSNPEKVKPDEEIKALLKRLSEDEKNKIVIVSGRNKDTLEKWLGDLNVDMIAEHGVWLKENRMYWSLFDYITDEWKHEIRPILELYVDRTPGTFIEEKDYSLVWHYRKADNTLGELRSRELVNHLQYITTNMPIRILEGNKVIEIKNASINKGKAAVRWLQEGHDFIFAAGDDWTDEDTFEAMPESSFTLKVGFSPTVARNNIASHHEMRDLFKEMIIAGDSVPKENEVEEQ